jgi:hypothetical protein
VAITNNNPTSSHTLTLALSQALDPAQSTFSFTPTSWVTVPITGVTFPATVPANSTLSFFFKSSSAARLALQVTGAASAAGSPDTANITIVQPSIASFCGSAGNASAVTSVIGAVGNGNAIPLAFQDPVLDGGQQAVAGSGYLNTAQYAAVDSLSHGWIVGVTGAITEGNTAAVNQLEALNYSANIGNGHINPIAAYDLGKTNDAEYGTGGAAGPLRNSRRYGTAVSSAFGWASDNDGNNLPLTTYNIQSDAVNPAAGQLLAGVYLGVGIPSLTPHKIYVSCSALCDVNLNRVSSAGTGCTALTIVKTFDPSKGNASQMTASKGACAANPTITYTFAHLWVAAGTTQIFDMEGYWESGVSATGNGFDVQEGAVLTGTASVTIDWMERGN